MYSFKSKEDDRLFPAPSDIRQGLVGHQVLQDGSVTEYLFSTPEVQFSQDLKQAMEVNGSSQYCFVSSQLSPQNKACVLSVEGMSCEDCLNRIETVISQISGVASIKVSLQFKEAFIEYNPGIIEAPELAEKIFDMGFNAAVVKTFSFLPSSLLPLPIDHIIKIQSESASSPTEGENINSIKVCYAGIDGMTCHSCVSLIESTIGEMEGVLSIKVLLDCKEGRIEFNGSVTSISAISAAVDDMGFVVTYIKGIVLKKQWSNSNPICNSYIKQCIY